MSISDRNIVELVSMLMRGIVSKVLVNPTTAAESFQKRIEELGADYAHADGLGYVTVDGTDVMMVHWTNDGVEFDEHTEHPMTLDFIKIALDVLQDQQRKLESCQTDEDSDDDDFEWV